MLTDAASGYPVTDIRHYGIFPGSLVTPDRIQAAVDASADLGITIEWPPGLYLVRLSINRSNVSFHMQDGAELAGIVHITPHDDMITDARISHVSITGTLVTYDRVGIISADDVHIDAIHAKSDAAKSLEGQAGRGVHIYYGARDITIGEVVVDDMGGQAIAPTNHAAIAIDGYGNNPQRVSIDRIVITDSGAHGMYVTGNDHRFGSIVVNGYAREPMTNILQDATLAESLNGAGVWFNRASAVVGSIEVTGAADGSRAQQFAGVVFDEAEIVWAVPDEAYAFGTAGITVGSITVKSGPGMVADPYGNRSGAVVAAYATATDYVLPAGMNVAHLSTNDPLGTAPITLVGNAFGQTIVGNAGANRLVGGDGDDTLVGGAGADRLEGGRGDDIYYVDDYDDVVIEHAGGGRDRVYTSVSIDLGGTEEIEVIAAQNVADTATLHLAGDDSANLIVGNDGFNLLNGRGGDDVMMGGGGGDILIGGMGADRMYGGAGDDLYYIDNVGDLVFEKIGEGYDCAFTSVSIDLGGADEIEEISVDNPVGTDAIDVAGGGSANLIRGNNGANVLVGRGGDDVLVGLGGDDTLIGGSGADTMDGGAGDDSYYVDNAGDRIVEAAGGGHDTVYAGVSFTLTSGAAVERLLADGPRTTTAIDLTGNEFANLIVGNAGDNMIDGKGGADILRGFGGADTFAFTTTLGAGNIDTIVDFSVGQDRIALAAAIFGGLATGALSATAFHVGATATTAGDRILYDPATGALWFDADGNGATAAVQFATIDPGLSVTAANFTVI